MRHSMKILMVGNYENDHQESMMRFASIMFDRLACAGLDVRLIRPAPFFGRLARSPHGLGKWLGYIDKFLIFPPQLAVIARWADVVHVCDHSNAPYVLFLGSRPNLVTCHDLLAIKSALGEIPEVPTKWSGKLLQQWILAGLKKSKLIACDSVATQNDVIRLCRVAPNRTTIVYLGLNYPYSPMGKARRNACLTVAGIPTDRRYIFHVGSNAWYKNRSALIAIYRQLKLADAMSDLLLVIVGSPLTETQRCEIHNWGLNECVIEVGSVDNQTLCALYSGASALVFPSLMEGFGWPILEAQACGCPVFATDRAPMTEVGGSAARYFSPDRPADAATAISGALADVESMRQAGLVNAANFTTENMVTKYMTLYSQLTAIPSVG